MKQELVKRSRFLSLVLRHDPSAAGVVLDEEGWVNVEELLAGCASVKKKMTREQLDEIVVTNNKRRFAFSNDGLKIRASQGHSVAVDLGMEAVVPPALLFHGTASHFVDAIKKEGIKKRSRQHVHLSLDEETANQVGSRHGEVVILTVNSEAMHADGLAIYCSENGVWLTDEIPVKYISF